MSKTFKKIIIILVVLVLAGIGASLFLGGEGSGIQNPLQSVSTGTTGAPLSQNTNRTSGNTEEMNREFVSMLLNLQSIKLSDDIFSEPAFSALINNTVRLNQPGNEGRPNPFAPIGTDSLISSQAPSAQASVSQALTETEENIFDNTFTEMIDEQLEELSSMGAN